MTPSDMSPLRVYTRQEGRVRLCLRALAMGEHYCVLLDGGDRPHIGAVALGRPGAEPPAEVLVAPGHREDALARQLASRLADALDSTVAVACGVHLDAITPVEIQVVERLALALADDLAQAVRHG